MSTPTKEELPRIADTLKSELESEHKLKHTNTDVKVVLPSKTGTYALSPFLERDIHFLVLLTPLISGDSRLL